MKYNFDEIIERKGTNSVKYDISRNRSKSEDIIPLWVADMDFRTLPAVVDELVKLPGMAYLVTPVSMKITSRRYIIGIKIDLTGQLNLPGWYRCREWLMLLPFPYVR